MSFDILDPSSAPATSTAWAPRSDRTLQGARIGVIWNGRPNGDHLLKEILAEIAKDYGTELAILEKKPKIGNTAPEAMLQSVAAAPVDYVLAGVGD